MDEIADRFLELIHELDDVTRTITVERACSDFDQTTLQVFWKRWPHVSAWAGSLWAQLSAELAVPATQHADPDLDEIGESG